MCRPAARPSAKNGTSGAASRAEIRPRFHQQRTRITAGSEHDDRLREERADEEDEREPIRRPATRCGFLLEVVEAEVGEERAQRERQREHVLPLGDPRDRLDHHRMHREDRRREPGSGHAEPPQRAPGEDGAERVQRDVHRVVARRLEPPELVLDPEQRVDERVVLRRRARREPDVAQPGERPERRVLLHVGVVVPDEARGERRQVDDRRQQDEERARRGGAKRRAGACAVRGRHTRSVAPGSG